MTPSQTLISMITWMFLAVLPGASQDPSREDIEAARLELQKQMGTQGLVKPLEVDSMARSILDLPLDQQSEEDLQLLARHANAAANYVGLIVEEYADYYRDNYKYDFVQKKIAPFHDKYVGLSNRMKDYRNQAYYNLGMKAAQNGDELRALFLFRDAFRFSTFVEEDGDHQGMRYKAEQEMKKLLGIDGMGSFVYWK